MKHIELKSWDDVETLREKMSDSNDVEDIALLVTLESVRKLNVQAMLNEVNYIRNRHNYDIKEYGYTSKEKVAFGYLYTKKED